LTIFDYFNFRGLLMFMRNTLPQLILLFAMYWLGLSYWVSGGLLVGVPGKQAGSLVHYALYELGEVL
jgi:hypothetical protein